MEWKAESVRVPAAPERLPVVFEALNRITDHAWRALTKTRQSDDRMEWVRLRTFDRAFNTFKAAKLLLQKDHWESAVPLVRLLFELLVNLEELYRAKDQKATLERYLRFAAVQDIRHQVAGLNYEVASGRRAPEEKPTPEDLERFCLNVFPDLVRTTKQGAIDWPRSWSGYNVRKLAERSAAAQPMRKHQYNTMYSFWSAYAHGAPVAVVGGFAALTSEGPLNFGQRHIECPC